jgi:hypothetical protein
MARPKSDWLLMTIGAIVGALAGLTAAGLTVWAPTADGSLCPAKYQLTYSKPPQAGVPAVLKVEVLGVWRYTRTAADPDAFGAELARLDALNDVPGVTLIVVGLVCGVMCVRYSSRWLQKRRGQPR